MNQLNSETTQIGSELTADSSEIGTELESSSLRRLVTCE
jgi:hypothetical protein